MREIKFRAWDGLKIVNDYTWIDNMGRMCVGWCGHDVELKLMQYTGLKDKNGVEIYEGDIIHRVYMTTVTEKNKKEFDEYYGKDFEIGQNIDDGHSSEVKWFENGWSFGKAGGYGLENCVVIGNIYQNPELLNQK